MEGEADAAAVAASGVEKELQDQLIQAGVKLLVPPASVDELLAALDRVGDLLYSMDQCISRPLREALLPAIQGLVSDQLLQHPNLDVKVSAISCIHEVLRISAPQAPYVDHKMEKIFQQTLVALEKLPLLSGRCYFKALRILETVAKVRSSMVLLDLGCEALIVQMFQLLLDTIGPNHPDTVFSDMEEIMTWLIQETDELSLNLLKPLLASATKENQDISPISWRLARKVLKNCSTEVKPFLMKAVNQMRLDIEIYTDVIAKIFPDESASENEGEKDASHLAQAVVLFNGPEGRNNGKSLLEDGTSLKILELPGENETAKGIPKESVEPGALEAGEGLQTTASVQVIPRRKGRKPKSERKEGYEHSGSPGGRTSLEVTPKRKNYGKLGSLSLEKSPLQSEHGGDWGRASLSRGIPKATDVEGKSGGGSRKKKYAVHNKKQKTSDSKAIVIKKEICIPSDSEATESDEECVLKIQNSDKPRKKNEYREDLIGKRLKVWWPLDCQFYEGVVVSYSPKTKAHKVHYFDGDIEVLKLRKERWVLMEDISTEQDQVADIPISSFAPVKSAKKTTTKQENAGSSKKRSQPEARKRGEKSTESSAKGTVSIKTERKDSTEEEFERPLTTEMPSLLRKAET